MSKHSTTRSTAGDTAAPRAGRILRVKAGYNPNSSSIGTVIFAVPAAMLIAPALYNVIAAAFTTATLRDRPKQHGPGADSPDQPQAPQRDKPAQ